MKIFDLVEKYVQIRQRKEEEKAAYQEKVAKYDEALDKIEAVLLQAFNKNGVDSIKTPAGTAYTTTRTSATVSDPAVFMKFVRDTDSWELVQARAVKTAVDQYKDVKGDVPPGVSWRSERVINIRKNIV